jgi:thioredoxin reductase (NADPH)
MENIVIIGSGPAGLTAGIYSSRAALNPILIAGLQPGGQLTTTSIVENWPGTPEGVDGNKLMQDMKAQAEKYGTRMTHGTVEKVEKTATGFKVVTDGETIETKAIIVATGASAITLDLPNKEKLMGYGLSTCAVCDGFFYRNKTVAVVGGGDSAMEEAHYLAKLASSVTLIHRRDKFRASKAMQEKVFNNPKIKVVWNTEVIDTLSDSSGLTGIVMKNNEGLRTELKVDGLFMAIGHTPNTAFLKGLVELDPQGYVLCKPGSTATNVTGIFAAGDVEDNKFRQAITSAGRGCQAALEAEKFIEGHTH